MTNDDMISALSAIRPGAAWVLRGSRYQDIEWLDEAATKPTEKELADAIATAKGRGVVAAVKAEARRRILAAFPDWKQANMTARGVELQDIWRRKGSWTEQEQVEADALQAAWNWIKAVRSASDSLEAMSPIPDDYVDDKWWPQ